MIAVIALAIAQVPPQTALPPELPPKPTVVTRAAWNAAPGVPEIMRRHQIRRITLHHTGTPQRPDLSLETKLKNLQLFSQREDRLADGRTKPAWGDVPYHFYISTDGRIGEARELIYAGDTNTDYDPAGHALIVLEGNLDIEPLHDAQWESIVALSRYLAAKYRIPPSRFGGHKDFARTSCPGEAGMAVLPRLRTLAGYRERFRP